MIGDFPDAVSPEIFMHFRCIFRSLFTPLSHCRLFTPVSQWSGFLVRDPEFSPDITYSGPGPDNTYHGIPVRSPLFSISFTS